MSSQALCSSPTSKGFILKKFTFGFAALVLASALIAAPAMAAGITVNVNTQVNGLNQLALAAALAGNSTKADATNAAGLAIVNTDWAGSIDSTADVANVNQVAGALALSWSHGSNATATVENVAALVDDTGKDVDSYATIAGNAGVNTVNQTAVAIAGAHDWADAAATNFAGGVIINVNQ